MNGGQVLLTLMRKNLRETRPGSTSAQSRGCISLALRSRPGALLAFAQTR